MQVAIIGAGMAGLTGARKVAHAGLAPAVIDKGRGIGGRLATRRVDGLQFDHGEQHVTARDKGFAAAMHVLALAGVADACGDASDSGKPGRLTQAGMVLARSA